MSQEKPIVIGYCRGTMVHGDFAHALAMLSMRAVAMGLWIGHQVMTTTLICAGRNWLVDLARKNAFSHLLFLDSDMWFPADTLERLLSHNLPMVGASYCMRAEPRCMTHRGLDNSSRLPNIGEYPNDVYEVQDLGMGCVLIKSEVFERLDSYLGDVPFFQTVYSGRTEHASEDIHFCRQVRASGVKIHCDIRLSRMVRHMGLHAYRAEDVQKVRDGESLAEVVSPYPFEATQSVPAESPINYVDYSQTLNWNAYAYGGGAPLPLGILCEQEAFSTVARDYGQVMHIDRENGFIFYKPKGWSRESP